MSKTLTEQQIKDTAKANGIEYAALKAVAVVESAGSGFFDDTHPKILFEGHIFWKELTKRGIDPTKTLSTFKPSLANVLYSKWDKTKYSGGIKEYVRLDLAKQVNEDAALSSASWGMFQVMGFNWKLCDYSGLSEFIKAMYLDEGSQLQAAIGFIKSAGLLQYLKQLNWASFAKGYNGSGYAENKYDIKLKQAYDKYK